MPPVENSREEGEEEEGDGEEEESEQELEEREASVDREEQDPNVSFPNLSNLFLFDPGSRPDILSFLNFDLDRKSNPPSLPSILNIWRPT